MPAAASVVDVGRSHPPREAPARCEVPDRTREDHNQGTPASARRAECTALVAGGPRRVRSGSATRMVCPRCGLVAMIGLRRRGRSAGSREVVGQPRGGFERAFSPGVAIPWSGALATRSHAGRAGRQVGSARRHAGTGISRCGASALGRRRRNGAAGQQSYSTMPSGVQVGAASTSPPATARAPCRPA